MHPTLQKKFESLEQRKQTFMTVLKTSTPQQVTFKATLETWNMLEVAQHLIQAEQGLSATAYKHLELGPVTVRSRLGYWFVVGVFKTPLKVKIPQSVRRTAEPKGGDTLTLAVIEESWLKVRQQLKTYLESQSETALAKPVTRHPLISPMTLAQMLGFFEVHISHHYRQLERLKQAPGFPR